MIVIGGKGYELVLDHKDGWNPEAFRGRYSEVLERYDYIIGDWGYSQLRLKGFFRDNHPKVNRDTAISSMVDYINEYCNFGCAYFVLHKSKEVPQEGMFKDILLKPTPEPIEEEDVEQQSDANDEEKTDIDVSAKESSSKHASGPSPAFKEMTKDRPVREHQSRNHWSKDSNGKKSKKDFQGRPQQGQSQKPQHSHKASNNHTTDHTQA